MKHLTLPFIRFQKGTKSRNWKQIPLTPFIKGGIIAIFLLTFFVPQKISAELIFEDNFNIPSGGGDVNYELYASGRQSGSAGSISWNWWSGGATPYVTNAGAFAGTCFVPPGASVCAVTPEYNFVDSPNFTIEFDLIRTAEDPTKSFSIQFGKQWYHQAPNTSNGFSIMFFQNGVYTTYESVNWTGWFSKAELSYSSNATLKIKICVSQPDFGGTNDAKIAMFINGRPYPLTGFPESGRYLYTYTLEGGLSYNYLTFSFNPDTVTSAIDNFRVVTSSDNSFQTNSWTGDDDSGITNTKFYTHAINFGTNGLIVNGVPFDGVGGNMLGTDWRLDMARRLGVFWLYHPFAEWGVNPNVTPESRYFLQDMLYDGGYAGDGGLSLSGLTPGFNYKLSLYVQGYGNPGERDAYFATSDGAVITLQDMNANGDPNGMRLSYNYTAPDSGQFALSTTATNLTWVPPATNFPNHNWGWFAFSNELLPPDAPGSVSASQGTYTDKVLLSWDAVSGAQNYSVFRAETNIFSSASEIQSDISSNSYDDTSALVTKYYWVKAGNTGGFSAAAGPALGYKASPSPPGKPTNTSPTSYDVVNAPGTFTASAYSDPGSYVFAGSQWRVSETYAGGAYWDSGKTIANNSLTIPANVILEGTNFWQVRYMNEFSTWSDWSDKTSLIYVPAVQGAISFLDRFTVTGSGDVNKNYNASGRQSGNAAPLTYKTEGTTEVGSATTHPGKLLLGQNSGCSPDMSFENSGNFMIEFDAEPHLFDGSGDWLSCSFGKDDQSSLSPISSSGLGAVFFTHKGFQLFAGETLIGTSWNVPTNNAFHVAITASTEGFDDSDPAICSVFINNLPMTIGEGDSRNFSYELLTGFVKNYVTLYSFNGSGSQPSLVDNFSVKETSAKLTVHEWTDNASSQIDPVEEYTHLVNLNGDDVEINGHTFIGTGFLTNCSPQPFCAYPNGAPEITKTNWAIVTSADWLGFYNLSASNSQISGTSEELAKHFVLSGRGSEAIQLFGLTPYSSNTMFVYSQAFENGNRDAYFTSTAGNVIDIVNMDEYGVGGGIIVQYDYIASKEGEFTLAINGAETHSYHVSGFANIETGIPECGIVFGILFSVFSICFLRKT